MDLSQVMGTEHLYDMVAVSLSILNMH